MPRFATEDAGSCTFWTKPLSYGTKGLLSSSLPLIRYAEIIILLFVGRRSGWKTRSNAVAMALGVTPIATLIPRGVWPFVLVCARSGGGQCAWAGRRGSFWRVVRLDPTQNLNLESANLFASPQRKFTHTPWRPLSLTSMKEYLF
jgi:hypothetical protein